MKLKNVVLRKIRRGYQVTFTSQVTKKKVFAPAAMSSGQALDNAIQMEDEFIVTKALDGPKYW